MGWIKLDGEVSGRIRAGRDEPPAHIRCDQIPRTDERVSMEMTPSTMIALTGLCLAAGGAAKSMGCMLEIISKLLFFAACALSVTTLLMVLTAESIL